MFPLLDEIDDRTLYEARWTTFQVRQPRTGEGILRGMCYFIRTQPNGPGTTVEIFHKDLMSRPWLEDGCLSAEFMPMGKLGRPRRSMFEQMQDWKYACESKTISHMQVVYGTAGEGKSVYLNCGSWVTVSCLEPGRMACGSLVAPDSVDGGNGLGHRSWQKPAWDGSILTNFSGLSKANLGRVHFVGEEPSGGDKVCAKLDGWGVCSGAQCASQVCNPLVKIPRGNLGKKFALPSPETYNLSSGPMSVVGYAGGED